MTNQSNPITLATAEVAQSALWQGFFDPSTHLLYDFRDPARDRHLPSDEEIHAEIPNAQGWMSGMEDCAIAGGAVLQGLVRSYNRSKSVETAARIRELWIGLKSLGTVGPSGFICRGLNLTGNSCYFPNSSIDQYKMYCSALFHYLRCDLCTSEDRALIAKLAVGIVERIRAAGMNISRADGAPGNMGDLHYMEDIDGKTLRVPAPDVLLYHALAAEATGDERWQNKYYDLVHADGQAALRHGILARWREEDVARYCVYIYMQGAYMFRALYDYETEPEIKAVYKTALRNIARASVSVLGRYKPDDAGGYFGYRVIFDWREYYRVFCRMNPDFAAEKKQMDKTKFPRFCWAGRPSLVVEMANIREPMEALVAIMLAGDTDIIAQVREKARYAMSSLPVDKLQLSSSLINIESIYVFGRDFGMW